MSFIGLSTVTLLMAAVFVVERSNTDGSSRSSSHVGSMASLLRATNEQSRQLLDLYPQTVVMKNDNEKERLPIYATILDDGTYYFPVFGERMTTPGVSAGTQIRGTCLEYLKDHNYANQITGFHIHNDVCGDESLGNIIPFLFAFQLLAHSMEKPFSFTCGSVPMGDKSLVGHLQVIEQGPKPVPKDLHGDLFPVQKFCELQLQNRCALWACPDTGMENAASLIIPKMREIASKFVDFEADDAVIHLRLGDVFRATGRIPVSPRGLLPHNEYEKILRQVELEKGPLSSISIVTAPFGDEDKDLIREKDMEFTERSRLVAEHLKEFLMQTFPQATVAIHNSGEEESPAKAGARLTRAKKVAICGCSSFCAYPVMAVADDALGYIFKSHHYNLFSQHLADGRPNIRVFESPMLGNNEMAALDETSDETGKSTNVLIHKWLRLVHDLRNF